jgi:flagellar hook-associated protein 2
MSSSSVGQLSIYDMVDQYMAIESRSRNKLIADKKTLESKKSVYSELDAKLSNLQSKLDYWLDGTVDYFAARTAASSDPDKISATANSAATKAKYSFTVERLAVSDTRVSNQYHNDDTSFSSFTTDQTFTIDVAHPTDDDADNREAISITIEADVFNQTDEQVLADIADAVNLAMQEAVNDETINKDEVINASVIHEETGTSRLAFNSEQTGFTYRMEFGSSALLNSLNINNSVQTSGTTGGYVTEVGSSANDSELNSKFQMNGLTFYRDSNSITDATDGLTIKFGNTFSQQETISVSTDLEAVKDDMNNFIEAYNDVVSYLKEHTQINTATKKHGTLQSDYLYSGMKSEMINILLSNVDTVGNSEYSILNDIGMEIDRYGKLSITDPEKFEEVLETNSDNMKDIFLSENGIAAQLDDYLNNYVKTGGLIDSSEKLVDSHVNSLNDRIDYMNELLERKEKSYFEEFSKLQETMYTIQNQQSFFNAFSANLSSGF